MAERPARLDRFPDIEFKPEESINCRARSCALAVALDRRGWLEPAMVSFDAFAARCS